MTCKVPISRQPSRSQSGRQKRRTKNAVAFCGHACGLVTRGLARCRPLRSDPPPPSLLAPCLLAVAAHASCLTIGDVVPRTASADWHHMVSVQVAPIADLATVHTRPVALQQDSTTPHPVGLVAIATRCCIGSPALIPAWPATGQPAWAEGWYALRHQIVAASLKASSTWASVSPNAEASGTSIGCVRSTYGA